MGRIKFGVRIPVTGPVSSREHLVDAALEAERLGFDAVFVGDHIAPGGKDAFERHKVSPPGGGSWRDPSNTMDPNQFEMIASLAYIAGRTGQIELGVGVTPLPFRDPIVYRPARRMRSGRFWQATPTPARTGSISSSSTGPSMT